MLGLNYSVHVLHKYNRERVNKTQKTDYFRDLQLENIKSQIMKYLPKKLLYSKMYPNS